MELRIDNLPEARLPAMMALERVSWPDDARATETQFKDRLRVFPDGFLGAHLDGFLVGIASCQIIRYAPGDGLKPWSELTADGWISRTHVPTGNCLHFVSICVHPDYRHRGIGTELNRARLELARRRKLSYLLTDTRLPGLRRFLAENPCSGPDEYVDRIGGRGIVEPVVQMYLSLGFDILGLIANCMSSDRESADYGLAMLKVLQR